MQQNITLNFNDFKAFELVFQEQATNKWKRALCQVQSVEQNKILLSANNEKNNNLIIPLGTSVFINIYTNSGIYTSDSTVISVNPGTMLTHYEIDYPKNTRHAQRREYFRADMAIHFFANITKENTLNIEMISTKTKNICGKGLSFIYPKSIGSYKTIEVSFTLADKHIKTNAELIYSHKVNLMGGPKYIHAFHFTTISKQDIDFIVKKCFLYQLERKKRGF